MTLSHRARSLPASHWDLWKDRDSRGNFQELVVKEIAKGQEGDM